MVEYSSTQKSKERFLLNKIKTIFVNYFEKYALKVQASSTGRATKMVDQIYAKLSIFNKQEQKFWNLRGFHIHIVYVLIIFLS